MYNGFKVYHYHKEDKEVEVEELPQKKARPGSREQRPGSRPGSR